MSKPADILYINVFFLHYIFTLSAYYGLHNYYQTRNEVLMALFSFPTYSWLTSFLQTEFNSQITLPIDMIKHIHSFIPNNGAVVIGTT